jgi:hypothetical protein
MIKLRIKQYIKTYQKTRPNIIAENFKIKLYINF